MCRELSRPVIDLRPSGIGDGPTGDALNQRVAAAGDHGVVVDSVTVSVLL